MNYYKICSAINTQTNAHDTVKEQDYVVRYFADFEELLGSVYWRVITPLLEMRRGHLTKVLEITDYRMPGKLVVYDNGVTITTENHTYSFEATDVNPLDVAVKE